MSRHKEITIRERNGASHRFFQGTKSVRYLTAIHRRLAPCRSLIADHFPKNIADSAMAKSIVLEIFSDYI